LDIVSQEQEEKFEEVKITSREKEQIKETALPFSHDEEEHDVKFTFSIERYLVWKKKSSTEQHCFC
jgi:hypothetical protein